MIFYSLAPLAQHLNRSPIVCYGYDYHPHLYNPHDFHALGISFPAELARAVHKRQAEYLAGRYSAKHALHALGVAVQQVPTGINRSPSWPSGIVGSITHTSHTALCAIAKRQHLDYLGNLRSA